MAIWTRWISEVRIRYPGSLPVNVYRGIVGKLAPDHRLRFDNRLSQLDYVLTGFARDLGGQDLAVAIDVFDKIGTPFSLTKLLRVEGSLTSSRKPSENEISFEPSDIRISFELPLKEGDEIWEYSSVPESWAALAGSAGFALVRQRTVIDIFETTMS